MKNGQYMLSGEFLALVIFFFTPPLLIATIVQTFIFARRGLFSRGRIVWVTTGYVGTFVGSVVAGAILHEFSPRFLGSVLRARDVAFSNQHWPVMPLAFIAVAVSASTVTWLIIGHVNAKS